MNYELGVFVGTCVGFGAIVFKDTRGESEFLSIVGNCWKFQMTRINLYLWWYEFIIVACVTLRANA